MGGPVGYGCRYGPVAAKSGHSALAFFPNQGRATNPSGNHRAPLSESSHSGDATISDPAMMLAVIGTVLAAPAPISVSYSTVVDMHISEIMPVFLSDELNHEWSPSLASHSQIFTREHGMLAHQLYKLPWPLGTRDVLLSCERKTSPRDGVLTSECRSVDNAGSIVPISNGATRMELSHTAWRIEALSDERTRLSLSLEMPETVAAGVPKNVVRYCQTRSLKDSVSNLIDAIKRLDLPAHESFLRWRRSSVALKAARRPQRSSRGASASTLFAYAAEHESSPSVTARLLSTAAMLCMVLMGHALAFACLARLWRGPRRSNAYLRSVSPKY